MTNSEIKEALQNGKPVVVKIPRQNNRRIDGALTFIMIYETYRRFKTEFSALIGENK